MIYALVTIAVAAAAFLITRIRLRIELSKERRILFFGLGRTGVEVDFLTDMIRLKLCGFTVRRVASRVGEEDEGAEQASIEAVCEKEKPVAVKTKKRRKTRRSIPIGEIIRIGAQIVRAVGRYIWGLIRSIRVEEAYADIRAGFESPDLTGQVYGYYFAMLGAIPALRDRIRFEPVWMEGSFEGEAKLSLAIPVYAVVYRTIVLMVQMPIWRMVRLFREHRRGVKYAK